MNFLYENQKFYDLKKTIETFKFLELIKNSDLDNKGQIISMIKYDIVNSHIGLINHVIKKNLGGFYSEDLIETGIISLYEAIDKFDYKKNVCFNTYAKSIVLSYLVRYYRKNKNLVNIPYHFHQLKKIYDDFIYDYYINYHKKPGDEEIKTYLENNQKFLSFKDMVKSKEIIRLFEIFSQDGENSLNKELINDSSLTLEDTISSDLTNYNSVINNIDDKILMTKLKNNLDPFWYYVIYHSILFPNMTYTDIASKFGVTKQYISSEIISKKEEILKIMKLPLDDIKINIDLEPLLLNELIEIRKLKKRKKLNK